MKRLLFLISCLFYGSCTIGSVNDGINENPSTSKQKKVDRISVTDHSEVIDSALNYDSTHLSVKERNKHQLKKNDSTVAFKHAPILKPGKTKAIIHLSPNQARLDSIKSSKLKNKK